MGACVWLLHLGLAILPFIGLVWSRYPLNLVGDLVGIRQASNIMRVFFCHTESYSVKLVCFLPKFIPLSTKKTVSSIL